jgi:hypothetical protein
MTNRTEIPAAQHGRSLKEESVEILRGELEIDSPPRDLAAAIRARLAPEDRVELELPAREPMRVPAEFG